MQKNVTLRLEEQLLKKAKHTAIEKGFSLSQWLANLLKQAVNKESNFEHAQKKALMYLKKGFNLGGGKFNREELYDRPSMLR